MKDSGRAWKMKRKIPGMPWGRGAWTWNWNFPAVELHGFFRNVTSRNKESSTPLYFPSFFPSFFIPHPLQ